MNDIEIREANLDDFNELSRLYSQVDDLHLNLYPELFNKVEIPRSKEYLDEIINSNDIEIIVVEFDNRLIGLAEIRFETYPENDLIKKINYLLIDNIVIDSNFRNKGLGKTFFEYCKNLAKEKGVNRIELKVYEKNQKALKFYESLGFETLFRKLKLEV